MAALEKMAEAARAWGEALRATQEAKERAVEAREVAEAAEAAAIKAHVDEREVMADYWGLAREYAIEQDAELSK